MHLPYFGFLVYVDDITCFLFIAPVDRNVWRSGQMLEPLKEAYHFDWRSVLGGIAVISDTGGLLLHSWGTAVQYVYRDRMY